MTDHFIMPKADEGWRHYKNSLYWIVGVATDTATGNPTVVYTDREEPGGKLYTRDLSVFLGFTDAHERRFTRERLAP